MSDTYHLTGPLDEKAARKCIAALRGMNDASPNAPWVFTISSEGGLVTAGTAIYSELHSYSIRGGGSHHIFTKVRGQAASAASLVFQAGDTRLMGKLDRIVLHEPQLTVQEMPLYEIRQTVAEYDMWLDLYTDVHLRRSNFDRQAFRNNMVATDWVVHGESAVELGFADALG